MIELSNSAPITLAPGASAVFDRVPVNTQGCTCYQANPFGTVKMTNRGVYQLNFSGNISGAAAGTPVQLSIAVGNVALPQSTMIATPAAANDLNNVAKSVHYENCCNEFSRATIVNTGTVDVTIGTGASFSVLKVR